MRRRSTSGSAGLAWRSSSLLARLGSSGEAFAPYEVLLRSEPDAPHLLDAMTRVVKQCRDAAGVNRLGTS